MAKTTRAELSSADLDAAIALVTRQLAALQRLKRAQDRHRAQQEIQRTLMARRRGQLADAQTEADACGALEWIERARVSETRDLEPKCHTQAPADAAGGGDPGRDPADAGNAAPSNGHDLGGEVPPQ